LYVNTAKITDYGLRLLLGIIILPEDIFPILS
jgi:hypothetical protein